MGMIDLSFAILSGRGQISPKDEIWHWIRKVSSDPCTQNIVEIGTFNGGGSSTAIVSGLLVNRGAKALGLESNRLLHLISAAKLRLKTGNQFRVLHGSLVGVSSLDSVELSEAEAKWYLKDRKTLARVRKLDSSQLPENVDLLVSDGGEFTGWADFKAMEGKVRGHIILDDTLTRKNRRVFEYLLNSNEYTLTASSPERQGTAWFTRVA